MTAIRTWRSSYCAPAPWHEAVGEVPPAIGCAEVDDAIGRALAALQETGQAENTLVILTADHGEQLGDH